VAFASQMSYLTKNKSESSDVHSYQWINMDTISHSTFRSQRKVELSLSLWAFWQIFKRVKLNIFTDINPVTIYNLLQCQTFSLGQSFLWA